MTTTESTALVPATIAQRGLLRPIARPEQMIEVHKEAAELIRAALEQGRDYGVIPGTGNKATLLKPGAERLCVAFGLSPRLEIVEREIDHDRAVEWSTRNGRGTSRGLYRYVVRCALLRDGYEAGSGLGACSTMESKYVRDPRAAENTALKMASKRALVAAVLSTLALSDRFTQDIEDHDHQEAPPDDAPPAPRTRTKDDDKRDATELSAKITAEFDRLREPQANRKDAVARMLGGRKAETLADLREVLATLQECPTPPLEGEVVDDKKEGTQ